MSVLTSKLIVASANMFDLYKKTHVYHINVVGNTFAQDHAFLGDLYGQFNGHFDSIAELIRIEGEKLPIDFDSSSVLSIGTSGDRDAMFRDVLLGIHMCVAALTDAHTEATTQKSIGTYTTLETVIEAMQKSMWMVSSMV